MKVQRVMDPPPFLAIDHEPRILEHLQVKRQPGLRRVERVLELTHATLTALKHLHDGDARFIGQRVKELGGSTGARNSRGHTPNVSIFVDLRKRASRGSR